MCVLSIWGRGRLSLLRQISFYCTLISFHFPVLDHCVSESHPASLCFSTNNSRHWKLRKEQTCLSGTQLTSVVRGVVLWAGPGSCLCSVTALWSPAVPSLMATVSRYFSTSLQHTEPLIPQQCPTRLRAGTSTELEGRSRGRARALV